MAEGLDLEALIDALLSGADYVLEEINIDEEKIDKLLCLVGSNPAFLYKPSDTLKHRVRDYREWCVKHEAREPDLENGGKLMEEIALLVFSSLKGYNTLLSYQSYADQYDLVIAGPNTKGHWRSILLFLGLKDRPVFVIEAKNIDEKVDVATFTRLCSIVQNNFENECGLGVFFTRSGATGFTESVKRNEYLTAARARQVIFHAKTGKPVIVLDDADIDLLLEPGGLLHVLRDKILEISAQTGLDYTMTTTWQRIDLPAHLKQYVPEIS